MKNFISFVGKEIFSNIEVMILLFLTWIVLFEEITPFVIITGILMPILVVVFTDQFLLLGTYDEEYMIGLWSMTKYIVMLVYEIFVAGMGVIPNIISGESDVKYVTCETKLDDDFLIDILANSVTLTPGTVTAEKHGKTLRILALDAPELDEDPREALPLRLEAILLKYEAKNKEKTAD